MIEIYFVSKKDVLYFFLVWGTVVLVFLSIVIPFIIKWSMYNFIWGLIGLIIIGFMLWLWFGTGYHIENNMMKVLHGPFKQEVDVQEIKKVSKKQSILATAALATDRLVIQYGKYNWDIRVSPKKEYDFIKLLLSQNPQIHLEGALFEKYRF